MSSATTSPAFMCKLQSRQEIAERTIGFQFEKPSGWIFKAGQSMDMTLLNTPETDSEGNTRALSIASAPHEETLMVATRMFGNLTLHNNAARTAVFVSGGIGITPFRSMLLRAAKEKLPHRIYLFFSNRRPEDAPFLGELQALERENPNYKLIATMTQMEKSNRPWQGETGLINKEMLSRYLKVAASPIYYIAGPPGMVKGLHEVLNKAGVDDDDIRTEEFPGY